MSNKAFSSTPENIVTRRRHLQRERAFSFEERAPKMPKKKRNFLEASAANRSDQTGPV
jgi:hypothetical protein